MAIDGIQGSAGAVITAGTLEGKKSSETPSFKEMITEYLNETNRVQLEAGEAIHKVATGEIENIHEVMIALEKSRLSLELIMEIRSKLLDAYRELMRMQM